MDDKSNNNNPPPRVLKNLFHNLFHYNRLDFTNRPDYYLYLTDKDVQQLNNTHSPFNYDPRPMIHSFSTNITDMISHTMDQLFHYSFPQHDRGHFPETSNDSNLNAPKNPRSEFIKPQTPSILSDSSNSDNPSQSDILEPRSFLDIFTDKNSPFFKFSLDSNNNDQFKSGWSSVSMRTYTDENGHTVTEKRTRDFDGKEEVTIERSHPDSPTSPPSKGWF